MTTKRTGARPAPNPPGRRGHPLLDEIPGLRQKVEELLQQQPALTLEGLREQLKATGFWKKLQELGHRDGVSRGTLSNERIKFERAKVRREFRLIWAQAYNAGEVDLLELDTAISGMISVEIHNELQTILDAPTTIAEDGGTKQGGFNAKAMELAELFRRQINAHTNLERSKMFINRGAARAEAQILVRVLDVLKKSDPNTVQLVVDTIRAASAEVRR